MPRKIFVKVQWEFPTAGHPPVFWKPYPSVKIRKNYAYTSSESLSTTMRNLYLESVGISKQSLNTLLRFRGFLWIFIGSSLNTCVRIWIFSKCRKHWDFTLKIAQARQSLLLLTQGNICNRLRLLNKCYILKGIKRAISRKLVNISGIYFF